MNREQEDSSEAPLIVRDAARFFGTSVQLLTPEEVSQATGLSVETLAQWRSRKRHLPYLKIGRRIRYDLKDVEAYLKRCRVSVFEQRRQK